MFDNPENIGPIEISAKIRSLGFGPNRMKRFRLLCGYSTSTITKEEWIEKYCIK